MAKERIELHISSALERNIVYDITGLTFMDSSGIGLIAAGYKVARNFGGKVTVLTDNERYLKILALSKMDDLAELKYVSGEENHRQAEKEGVK
jgi:stage II sporulation protein AA (anti-sigma F factor antagonist)